MEIAYSDRAQNDLNHWRISGNKGIQKKIAQLITAIEENHFEGIGKPEPLKYELSGQWSRRIDLEHRIVYQILEDKILIHSLKGHY